jgi:hypothetical protein
VKLEYISLTGTFLRLQPFAPELKAEVRSAVDHEWPELKARLQKRVESLIAADLTKD